MIPRNEISKIVYGIFTRDRFDADLTARKSKHRKRKRKNLPKISDSDSSTTDSQSESDTETSSTSESNRDSKRDHRRRRKKKKKRKKKSKSESSESDKSTEGTSSDESDSSNSDMAKKKTEEPTTGKDKGKRKTPSSSQKSGQSPDKEDDEVEKLVDQLSRMKVSDTDYARIYYRATKKDAAVADIVAAPMKASTMPYTQARSRIPLNTARDIAELFCFGCGEHDHMMRQCPSINEWVSTGKIKKDEFGRLTYRDGNLIRRRGMETFKEAIQRTTMQSNLMRAYPDEEGEFEEDYADVYEMQIDESYFNNYYEDEEDTEYDSPVQTYAVARDQNEIKTRVRERQAVVKGPANSTSQRAKGMPNGPTRAVSTNPYGTRMNPNTQLTADIPSIHARGTRTSDSKPQPEPIPIDARPTRNPIVSGVEDVEMTNSLPPAVVGQNPSTTLNEDVIAKRRAERQPLITKKFEADSLM